MIEVALLFCFVAILSAVVSLFRGIAMVIGVIARPVLDQLKKTRT